MSTYRWNHVSFAAPPSVVDETVLVFVDDRDEPAFSLTLADDVLPPGASLAIYVDGAISELRGAAAGYEPVARVDRKAAKQPAIQVEHVVTAGNEARHQIQVYIKTPKGVLAVTATASKGGLDRARQALETLLSTLQFV